MNLGDSELMAECGKHSGDDARPELLWAFFLYVRADDVKLRLPIRDRNRDIRVAEAMANMAKSYMDFPLGCRFQSVPVVNACLSELCTAESYIGRCGRFLGRLLLYVTQTNNHLQPGQLSFGFEHMRMG